MPAFSFLTPRDVTGERLSELAARSGLELVAAAGSPLPVVTSVSLDSRDVMPGALFAALPGRNGHGRAFIARAGAAGAAAVLTDTAGLADARAAGLPTLLAGNPRRELGPLAARIYGTDRRRPALLGVTGTNGKTTTVHVLDALLRQLGVRAGHSSTATRRSANEMVSSRLTSPEAPELHALLARMVEDGVHAAAVEVSAQALSRDRVGGITFDVAGFTNLSHDHMDDYADMADYLEAKARLFRRDHSRRGVVLLDSPAGATVAERAEVPVVTVSSTPGVADWHVQVLDLTPTCTRFRLRGPSGEELITTVPLVGAHMAADSGLALVMLVAAGHDFARIARAVSRGIDVVVPGRTVQLAGQTGPRFYIDFSHTPDSVEKTVAALRAVTRGRMIVMLGGDGDRDPSKREPMGRAAADGADLVIVTDHHPRFEDPGRIRAALRDGARGGSDAAVFEIAEPARAVRTAVRLAEPDDTVLWVGPGDTDYRVVEGVDIPYSPRRDARAALDESGWGS